MSQIEASGRKLALRVGETAAGERLLNGPLGRAALLTGRRAVRAFYQYSVPQGRLEAWTPEQLSQETVRRGAIQKPSELAVLLQKLTERRPTNILELGTAVGGMVFAFCHVAVPDATITTVGLPKSRFGDSYGKRGETLIRSYAGAKQRLNLVQGDTHASATRREVEACLRGQAVDLLFIDGDHSLEGVQRDFEDYKPYVQSGGIVVVHDTIPNPLNPDCKVPQFWETQKGNVHTSSIEDRAAGRWGGYGIVEIA